MAYESTKVLIWGKTYPELSKTYTETVCTGGCREDGSPIRLYPVQLRYLEGEQQYSLYDWIDVPIEKSTKDPRPESFKVRGDDIKILDRVPTDKQGWGGRRALIFKDTSWHYGSVAALKSQQKSSGKSIGFVTPSAIDDVRLVAKSDEERQIYLEKMAKIQSQQDFFRTEYKQLAFLPYEIKLRWRCSEICPECPHDMKVLDWGLLELARKAGWDKARDRLAELSDLQSHDFRLFMGNFRLHLGVFGIIGLWYPAKTDQTSLL